MSPAEFKAARHQLGLSARALGVVLGVHQRTIMTWEADPSLKSARPPHPVACRAMEWMLAGFRPKEWGETVGNYPVDRPALSTSEIEVTPEMIEAGVDALMAYGPEGDSAEMVAMAVFERMMRASAAHGLRKSDR